MLLGEGRKILLRKLERLLQAAPADELDQPLLLQVEGQRVLLLQYLQPARSLCQLYVPALSPELYTLSNLWVFQHNIIQ